MKAVIEMLLGMGWTANGHTDSDTVRIPTSRSPVFGGIGGEVRTIGGRIRFSKGDRRRVTVGPRTTCFYEVVDKKAQGFVNCRTKDLEQIRSMA